MIDSGEFRKSAAAANRAVTDAVRKIAEAKRVAAAQVAIAWGAAQEFRIGIPVVPIPGTKRVKWIEQNAAALDSELTTRDLAILEPLAAQVAGAGTEGPGAPSIRRGGTNP